MLHPKFDLGYGKKGVDQSVRNGTFLRTYSSDYQIKIPINLHKNILFIYATTTGSELQFKAIHRVLHEKKDQIIRYHIKFNRDQHQI